jgi:hypothetical protein
MRRSLFLPALNRPQVAHSKKVICSHFNLDEPREYISSINDQDLDPSSNEEMLLIDVSPAAGAKSMSVMAIFQ